MSSADFNVTTAGALVLGGIGALVLATVIALGGWGRPRGRAPTLSAPAPASSMLSAGGAPSEAEIEYLLDTSEPLPAPSQRTP